jgi:signal transduction histidine kinase
MVTDTQGNFIYGKIVDPLTGCESQLPEHFNQILPPGHPFLNFTSLSGTNTGILLLPTGPIMIASSPVLNNSREGPSYGVLVMGRSLNDRAFTKISRVTGNPISAHWNEDGTTDGQQLSLLQQLNPDFTAVSIPRSEVIISGYTVINDVNGQKILIVTDQPRDLYQNGLSIIKTYLVIFIFAILVTLVIVLFVVDQTILKRLNILTNRVRKMGQGHNDDMKPELIGSDEIAHLEQVILSACTDLKNSEQELMKISTSLAVSNQKLNLLSSITRHDINNQVFVLSSYLELAKHQLAGQDRIIEIVEKGVQATQIIQEVIAYSKDYKDLGTKPPSWQSVKMTMLYGLSHISIGEIQHTLDIGNLEIFADPLLEKVSQRLFENSMKHGEHVTRIRVWHTITPDGATVVFEDDGTGIPQEMKEQIFLRDESTGRTSMRSLIFVREILDITGITITETGEPGKGARFEIVVPMGAWRMSADTNDIQGRGT